MGLNEPDPTYTPSLLERYGQCESDIAVLQAMLKGFTQDEASLGLNLDQTILRSIRRAEEERERIKQEYEAQFTTAPPSEVEVTPREQSNPSSDVYPNDPDGGCER